jgi:hypothetical protein
MLVQQRPLSGPVSVRVAGLALAAIAGLSFYNGLSRQAHVASHHGPSGHVVVIPPKPQIIAWQQGATGPLVEPVPSAEPRRSRRHSAPTAPEASPATPPAAAATDTGRDAAAQEPAASPSPAPATDEPSGAPGSPGSDAPGAA